MSEGVSASRERMTIVILPKSIKISPRHSISTYMAARTHLGKSRMYGRSTKVASNTTPEHTKDAICVRPPTSPFMRERVIEPNAGRVPGMNDPATLDAPRATSSRLGLME